MKIQFLLSAFSICLLAACSSQTGESSNAQVPDKDKGSKTSEPADYLTAEQLNDLRRTRTVAVVFTPATGSSGNGEVMKELKAINGPLREPNLNYDVFEPQDNISNQELKQQIEISLDRDRRVLIDNGGSAESRKMADALVTEVVGGFIPDTAGTIILKAPEDKGGGYLTIPLYSKADIQKQVSQGRIPNAQAQNNSIENFFFEPKTSN